MPAQNSATCFWSDMNRHTLFLAVLLVVGGPSGPVCAQPGHYDLGQKLRAFEKAWNQASDPAARRRAMPVMKGVVPLLFAGQKEAAAQAFDRSRFLLRSADEPSPAERWAASLVVRPSFRLVDSDDGRLAVTLTAYYD